MPAPYPVSECGTALRQAVHGHLDRATTVADGDIRQGSIQRLLAEGERSAVFDVCSNALVQNWYGGHGVSFYYLNVGEEMGRVEVPSWVAEGRDPCSV